MGRINLLTVNTTIWITERHLMEVISARAWPITPSRLALGKLSSIHIITWQSLISIDGESRLITMIVFSFGLSMTDNRWQHFIEVKSLPGLIVRMILLKPHWGMDGWVNNSLCQKQPDRPTSPSFSALNYVFLHDIKSVYDRMQARD